MKSMEDTNPIFMPNQSRQSCVQKKNLKFSKIVYKNVKICVKKLYLTLQKLKTSILRMKFSPKIPNIK